jgi:hypothetical protein
MRGTVTPYVLKEVLQASTLAVMVTVTQIVIYRESRNWSKGRLFRWCAATILFATISCAGRITLALQVQKLREVLALFVDTQAEQSDRSPRGLR